MTVCINLPTVSTRTQGKLVAVIISINSLINVLIGAAVILYDATPEGSITHYSSISVLNFFISGSLSNVMMEDSCT